MVNKKCGSDETITSQVVNYIRNQILVSKKYKKGDKIVESKIAEKFNISELR